MKIISQDDCMLFAGAKDLLGYPRLGNTQRFGTPMLHRNLYMEKTGESIPEGMEIHHLCNNPPCVNIDHLVMLSYKDHLDLKYGGPNLCKRGHELTEDNVYWSVKNKKLGRLGRQCKTCRLEAKSRKWYSTHKDGRKVMRKDVGYYMRALGSIEDPYGLFEPYIWKDKLGDSMWHCEIKSVDAVLVSVADVDLNKCLKLAWQEMNKENLL